MVLLSTLAISCGSGETRGTAGTGRRSAADVNEVLLDRGYGKPLLAIDTRTCATRELPIIGRDPVAFTSDHQMAATLRRIDPIDSNAKPSRLAVGPASQDERATVWTVGDGAPGGMAFDPSGERIALGLQRTTNRGGTISPDAVDDGLWIINRTGEGKRQLVTGYPYPFAWSPNGKQIASASPEFASDGSESGIKVWIVDVESGRQRTLATLAAPILTEGVLDWSPNGENLLLIIWPTGRSQPGSRSQLEQIAIGDGHRAPLLGPVPDDLYQGAVYAADGRTVISQRVHVPSGPLPQGSVYVPSLTRPLVLPSRRTADLVSVQTDGTNLRSLCPTEPDDSLLDWH